uniref:Wsv306-like protein n=1 Tax=Armadillidium vulgare clopovirus TaxID=2984284 RepID=A0A9C7EZ89_9VIRU|nr:MAG: wsv306-like protein [Armadillidium vulgare clopovirus]
MFESSVLSFNCEKINVPCTTDPECKILCQRVSDIGRINEVSYYTCKNRTCHRVGIPENVNDLALSDLNDLRKNEYRGLETFEAKYVKKHSDDFVLKRALYYLELIDNYIEGDDDDDTSITNLNPNDKEVEEEDYDDDDDDDDFDDKETTTNNTRITTSFEEGGDDDEKEERKKWMGKKLEKDAEIFINGESETTTTTTIKNKSNKRVIKFSDIKKFHGISSSSSSSSSSSFSTTLSHPHSPTPIEEKERERDDDEQKSFSNLETVFEINDSEEYVEKYLAKLTSYPAAAADATTRTPSPPSTPFRFLCNEEMGAGFEISRHTLFKNDRRYEIPICLCLHPEKLFGPACKWRTNFDVTDYDLWEESGGKMFPLQDNIDDYNKALDFCRRKNINLVTYYDSFYNTYFCKPKAERVQEILTNNGEGNIPSIIESQLLLPRPRSSSSSTNEKKKSDAGGDHHHHHRRFKSGSKLRLNIFEYNLTDILFNTPTHMNV